MTLENFKQIIKKDFAKKKFTPEEAKQLPLFVAHWGEELKNGKGILYDTLKSWSTGRRFGTWMRNVKKWDKTEAILKPKQAELKFVSAEDRARGREKMEALRKKMRFNK